ncbi:UbiX family flavin prenyltransferase [Sphingobacterium deserti]|uniref:Flavin prenyltransferase UbiX n=1 Tax=Sphingobacterium deserti TaxID=1229276 RepID=A0A0B8SZW7_9SPHI|nr:UbiX family flavin prenyltransferase [Sphingobacterium deserti]KGE13266.1 3-octaprenyl-4-hydroxybenzoate carboxy-lyase [Sphingobacterium deserti]
MQKKKVVVAVTGASGSLYAKVLLDKLSHLQTQVDKVAVVMSDNAKDVWKFELGTSEYNEYTHDFYDKGDFMAPFASGSAGFDTMIVCPCSMGTLARVAHGISSDLTTRAADVILKERRRLVLVTRETPLSSIHIQNMAAITQAGGIICPASPSFYSNPRTFEELAATVVDRVLSLCDIRVDSYSWGE